MSHHYHWPPATKRRFIEVLADTGSVAQASAAVQKSPRAAYDQRKCSETFAVAWGAALGRARANLTDKLMEASMEPIDFVEVRNPETGRKGWQRADPDLRSGMGVSRLQRLDRAIDKTDPARRAYEREVECNFEPFLDLMERQPSRAEMLEFLFAREMRQGIRIHCEVPQNSAISEAPKNPALAHSPTCGHRHPRTN